MISGLGLRSSKNQELLIKTFIKKWEFIRKFNIALLFSVKIVIVKKIDRNIVMCCEIWDLENSQPAVTEARMATARPSGWPAREKGQSPAERERNTPPRQRRCVTWRAASSIRRHARVLWHVAATKARKPQLKCLRSRKVRRGGALQSPKDTKTIPAASSCSICG